MQSISSETTLEILKLRVLELHDVHPESVKVFSRGRELTAIPGANDMTLRELEVYPDETLVIFDTQQLNGRDLTGIKLPGLATVKEANEGVGFGNTFFAGT